MPVTHDRVCRMGLAVPLLVIGLASLSSAQAPEKVDKDTQKATAQAARVLSMSVDAARPQPEGAAVYTAKANGKEVPVRGATPVQVSWDHDTFRAVQGNAYLPFTVTMDAKAMSSPSMLVYIRLEGPAGAAPAAPPAGEKKSDDDKEKASAYPFERLLPVEMMQVGDKYQFTRAVVAPGGSYDLYVAAMPRAAKELPGKQMVDVFVLKQPVKLPDFWNGELTTSSLLLLASAQQLSSPPTQESLVERPYTFTGLDIAKSKDGKFKKGDELGLLFNVYNPKTENKKPDVTIEYNFLRKEGEEWKPATSDSGGRLQINPYYYTAETLPADFDADAGGVINGGFFIPLKVFPAGQYRVEVKILDKKANATLTRSVDFEVVAPEGAE